MYDATKILNNARSAANDWAVESSKERVKLVRALRIEIASNLDYWVNTVRSDIGKPALDALGGDVLTTLEFAKYYERYAHKYLKSRRIPSGAMFWRNRFYESVSPVGVVLVISPWNYPLQLSLVPVITALCAGNAVILKPSEYAPKTAEAIRDLFRKIGAPKDLVTICEGDGAIGSALIEAKPDFVFFTGSVNTGRLIAEKCGTALIPHALEMGGKDVMIVRADAHLQRAARGASYGAFVNSGQVCVGVKRILVQKQIKEEFLGLLKNEISQIRVGDSPDADMGRLALPNLAAHLKNQIEESIRGGAKLETPLKIEGSFFYPVVISDLHTNSRILREESFGPVVLLDEFESDAEAVRLANDSSFGLGASVWSRDLKKARALAEKLVVGSCAINNVIMQIANPAAPFGGEKNSGIGRYHGREGLLLFSRKKTVMVDSGRRAREINWFSFSKKTFEFLKKVIRFRHLTLKWLPLSIAAIVLLHLVQP